jgi:K+-sensing histidine kinase KdpD
MNKISLPIPKNEMERILDLSSFDLDYSNLQNNFADLTKLAAKVAGTEISLVNLIDTYTQWSVSNYGLEIDQMPRENSVCQYTIAGDDFFEVDNLSTDPRFKDKSYVVDDPKLKYYYGVPLKTENGNNIGALCVLDKTAKELSPEKAEMLKIIAAEIVNRFKTLKAVEVLRNSLEESNQTQKKVAHDIRGPLAGIIGLAQIISEQGKSNQIDEVLEFINLIYKSGRSILDLADEILTTDKKETALKGNELNLLLLKDKLVQLYGAQARNKNINFTVTTSALTDKTPFSKNKLLQIAGNLISNSMKFTPESGSIHVELSLIPGVPQNVLQINVKDTGIGMDADTKNQILNGSGNTTNGTGGEQGYGFGLVLVKHLIESLKGTMNIVSEPGHGTSFEITLPQTP